MTDRQTDGWTDGRGALQYLPSWAFGAAGDNNDMLLHMHVYCTWTLIHVYIIHNKVCIHHINGSYRLLSTDNTA